MAVLALDLVPQVPSSRSQPTERSRRQIINTSEGNLKFELRLLEGAAMDLVLQASRI